MVPNEKRFLPRNFKLKKDFLIKKNADPLQKTWSFMNLKQIHHKNLDIKKKNQSI